MQLDFSVKKELKDLELRSATYSVKIGLLARIFFPERIREGIVVEQLRRLETSIPEILDQSFHCYGNFFSSLYEVVGNDKLQELKEKPPVLGGDWFGVERSRPAILEADCIGKVSLDSDLPWEICVEKSGDNYLIIIEGVLEPTSFTNTIERTREGVVRWEVSSEKYKIVVNRYGYVSSLRIVNEERDLKDLIDGEFENLQYTGELFLRAGLLIREVNKAIDNKYGSKLGKIIYTPVSPIRRKLKN
jgi:hypothetical protein